MYKILITFILVTAGCSIQPPPTAAELSLKFSENMLLFHDLKRMIMEDTGERDCFVVGTDNIGEYWEYDGLWSHSKNYQDKITVDEVLSSVKLSVKRYDEYLNIFKNVGVERVTHCKSTSHGGDWVKVLGFRTGLSVSGCSGTFQWFQKNPVIAYGKRGEGSFLEVHKLNDGWQSMMDCT